MMEAMCIDYIGLLCGLWKVTEEQLAALFITCGQVILRWLKKLFEPDLETLHFMQDS